MDYQLISKVGRNLKVLKTPHGVQIWMKGKLLAGSSPLCCACGGEIGDKPFFVPMAGESLPNEAARLHAQCMAKFPLLPMVSNTLSSMEEGNNDKQQ